MRRSIWRAMFFPTLFFTFGCDQSFNPEGVFEEKLVVYSVVTAETDTQFVRVYAAYDPPGQDPNSVASDNPLLDAQVSISGSGQSIQLADTTILRVDKSRYTTDVHAFVARGFRVQPGVLYNLTVASPSRGSATANVTLPAKGKIDLTNSFVLDDPMAFRNDDILLYLTLSAITRGYVLRFCVEYEITVNGAAVVQRDEVPGSIQTVDGNIVSTFPGLTRKILSPERRDAREVIFWSHAVYVYFLKQLLEKHGSSGLRWRAVYFFLTQVEPSLYTYYNVVNGFRDSVSIRMDQPDYTNVEGGVGVFGAMTLDSAFHALPPDIRLN